MGSVSLALLGPPIVQRDGRPVSFDTRKAVALLALLAVTGREQGRERLATWLWPDSDDVRARGSLRRTLSVTAAGLGDGLVISRGFVALRPDLVRVDLTEFEELIGGTDADSLERAVRLYRDDFLAGFSLRDCPEFDNWQAATADRLRQDLAGGLERLVGARARERDYASGLEYARRWLALDPLCEPAHQALIRLHAWTGQRATAMRQYRSLVRILSQELAVSPLPETTRLYDDVRTGRLGPLPTSLGQGTPGQAAVRPAAPGRAAPGRAAAVPVTGRWPLVGRAGELAVLDSCLAAVGPAGQVAAITGESGSGKSRLVAEFRGRAESAGAAVIACRCHDGEAELPFALAADLLRAAAAARPELPSLLPGHVRALAGRLVPELADGGQGAPEPPLASALALTRLYSAAAATLLAVGRQEVGQASAILVEDVQWADGPSLDLLTYLVNRLSDWPLLLVVSWRPELDERLGGLRAAIGGAVASGRGVNVESLPFTIGEIERLLEVAGAPPEVAPAMLAETRGLPLLVREYTDALVCATPEPAGSEPAGSEPAGSEPAGSEPAGSEPAGSEPAGPAARIWSPPASVRELLTRRLRAASQPTPQILSAAAVLGSGFDLDLLRAVSGRGEAETVDALDEALARFLLTEIPPPASGAAPSYDFPFEALRRVAYDSATLARRRLLHGRAADALAARFDRDPAPGLAPLIAGHLQRAGREPEAARWWWLAAARARELYAHGDAYAHLRRAVALGYPPVPGGVAIGDELTILGRYHEAMAEYEAAAAACEADRVTAAAIEHKLAEVRHRLGDWTLAEAHLAAALELLPADDHGRRARVQADRAVVAYRRGAAGEAAELGQRALAEASAGTDRLAMAQARNVFGMLAARKGDRAVAEEQLRASLADAVHLPDPGVAVAALNNLARLLIEAGRADAAIESAREALRLGSEFGDQHRLAALHTNLADALHQAGQQDEAMRHLKEAARRFAAVDPGVPPNPEIWTLVEW